MLTYARICIYCLNFRCAEAPSRRIVYTGSGSFFVQVRVGSIAAKTVLVFISAQYSNRKKNRNFKNCDVIFRVMWFFQKNEIFKMCDVRCDTSQHPYLGICADCMISHSEWVALACRFYMANWQPIGFQLAFFIQYIKKILNEIF